MRIIITILLVCFGFDSYSQTVLDTDGLNSPDNVFLYSLKEYCKTLNSTTKVIYVRKEYPIGDSWPKDIEGFRIEYLNDFKEYKEIIKKNNGEVVVVGIGPLHLKNGNFYVSIIPFGTTYKGKTIHFSNGGGWNFYFNYDPEKKGLIYKSKVEGGI